MDNLRMPQKLENLSHAVVTLLSNFKTNFVAFKKPVKIWLLKLISNVKNQLNLSKNDI